MVFGYKYRQKIRNSKTNQQKLTIVAIQKLMVIALDAVHFKQKHLFRPMLFLTHHASAIVQPEGIPLPPLVQPSIDSDLTNVPEYGTPSTQVSVQLLADISVARHFM